MGRYLDAVEKRGLSAWLEGDKLRVFPKRRPTDELRCKISEHKRHIVSELEAEETKATAARAQMLLDDQGWCAIASDVLGETVLFLRDETVSVPAKWEHAATYTQEELTNLGKVYLPRSSGKSTVLA